MASPSPRRRDSIAEINAAGILTIGAMIGVTLTRSGLRHGMGPCLSCGATDRTTANHIDKRRGPIGLRPDSDAAWRCHVCQVGGDVATLVALHLTGQARPDRDGWRQVVAWADEHLAGVTPATRPMPIRSQYPPAIDAFKRQLVGVTDDTEVCLWLSRRGLDVEAVAELCCVAVLPEKATVPSWASCGKPWPTIGHRLVAPMYDVDGIWRSVHTRAVVDDATNKSLSPSGYSTAGLCMASRMALRMLRDERQALEHVRTKGLTICEGLSDWISQQTAEGSDGAAVVGIIAGSWTAEHAARVPDGATVLVAVDHDAAGEKYTRDIARSFAGRAQINLRRWRPPLETGGIAA